MSDHEPTRDTDAAADDARADDPSTGDSATDNQPPRPWSERMLDQAFPDELDWRQKVQSYPLAALLVATGLGFALGRTRGSRLFSAVTGFAADRVTSTITNAVDPADG